MRQRHALFGLTLATMTSRLAYATEEEGDRQIDNYIVVGGVFQGAIHIEDKHPVWGTHGLPFWGWRMVIPVPHHRDREVEIRLANGWSTMGPHLPTIFFDIEGVLEETWVALETDFHIHRETEEDELEVRPNLVVVGGWRLNRDEELRLGGGIDIFHHHEFGMSPSLAFAITWHPCHYVEFRGHASIGFPIAETDRIVGRAVLAGTFQIPAQRRSYRKRHEE